MSDTVDIDIEDIAKDDIVESLESVRITWRTRALGVALTGGPSQSSDTNRLVR